MLQNAEHWMEQHLGWLGTVIAILLSVSAKFWQDHMKIKELQEEMDEVKSRVARIEELDMTRIDILARLETQINFLVDTVKENTTDIKNLGNKK